MKFYRGALEILDKLDMAIEDKVPMVSSKVALG